MKTRVRIIQVLFIGMAVVVLQSCGDPIFEALLQWFRDNEESSLVNDHSALTLYGLEEQIGEGTARAWIRQHENGTPVAAGVRLSERALENLPVHPQEYVLEFPEQTGGNFYTHARISWYPAGNGETGIDDMPHFDVQFLMQEEASAAAARTENKETHICASDPGCITSLTKEYLLSQPNDEIILSPSDSYQTDGWYATRHRIVYSLDRGEYYIALTGLAYRAATPVL